jgi:class 3 adenylate cyclase
VGTQTATILVTDLVGSTAMRADLGEERAESVRRDHDRSLIDAAQANGGTLVKGLGDGVLVMFAGAAEAVAAAVAMQRAVDLHARNEQLGLAIRVGISAGDVTLEDGDCFGTPVVEASRLCAAAEGGHILVADVVRILARGRGGHEMAAIGALELKGLAEPVPTFDVNWEPAVGAADLRTRSPYVGRIRERELLASRLAAARDDAGGLVLIAGEPGIGKTRLAAEVCSHFDGLTVLIGGCHDGDVVPYAPFAEAITDWVRRTPAARVRTTLGADAAVVARLATAIGDVVPDVGEPVPIPADAETARLHDAVGQVLMRLGDADPLALVVEDLHWADDATVGMLRTLARVAARTHVLVIGTYRETDLDRRHPFAKALPELQREVEVTRIALDGLGGDDVLALLERISGHPVPPAFAERLALETDGNPFFLRETLLHLADEGQLRVEDGVWVAAPNIELSIPAGVRDVIGRRLSRLSPDANKLLAAGALFEVSFPLTVAAAVTRIDEDEALDAIDEALDARIVTATGEFDRYAFTHALFRHTLVEELNPSRQVRMHRAIAEAIEKDLRGTPDAATAAMLARHYLHSAAIPGAERGVPHALVAADDAASRYARREEFAALQTAAELLEEGDERSVEVHCRRARAGLLAQADSASVLAHVDTAAQQLADAEGTDAAADYVVELLRLANTLEDITVSWRLAHVARRWLRDERRDRQWALVRQAELEERDHNDPATPGIPVDDEEYRELRSVIAGLGVEFEDQFRYSGPATGEEARARMGRGSFGGLFSSGEWRAAIALLGERAGGFREQGLVAMEAFVLAIRSRLETVVGDFDAAAEDLDAALALLPRIAPGSNQYLQVLVVPMLRDSVGGIDLGSEVADVLLAASERPDTRWAGLALRLAAARALASDGEDERARAILDEAMRPLERAGGWAPNAQIALAFAVETAWRLEDAAYVPVLERNVREKWLDPDLDYPEVDARWSYALLCALDGRSDDARNWFAEARRVLAERDSEPLIVGVEVAAAEAELRFAANRDGDSTHFAACIDEARRRCTHPAMSAWRPRLDQLEARGVEVFDR